MNKVINGKRYDTDTAKAVGSWENMDDASSFDYRCETLYLKRTGEFFLHCEGGASTPYASFSADGWAGWGEVIRPLGYLEARKWAEERLSGEEREDVFPTIDEDAGNVPVTLSIPAAAKARLDEQAAKSGRTRSDIVAQLISESAAEVKELSDQAIREMNARRPCITEGGECHVVKSISAYVEGDCLTAWKITDMAVFATAREACEYAAKMTLDMYKDVESTGKHMYTVDARYIPQD